MLDIAVLATDCGKPCDDVSFSDAVARLIGGRSLVIHQPWTDEFAGQFAPPIEVERTAICQIWRDGDNAHSQHPAKRSSGWVHDL